MAKRRIFKVIFVTQDKCYEIYARKICESEMFGFLEVEEIIFGENSTIVVDPSEEKLKLEFAGVKRCYIPMYSIMRIDEVEKESVGKIKSIKNTHKTNISVFPGGTHSRSEDR